MSPNLHKVNLLYIKLLKSQDIYDKITIMAEVEQGPEIVGGTYLLSHDDVISVIKDSGGSMVFTERLAEEIEAMYGDRDLHGIDRYGWVDGYSTTEIMAAGGADYDVVKMIGSNPDARLRLMAI